MNPVDGLSAEAKTEIANSAATLTERLTGASPGTPTAETAEFLDDWREYVADGDADRFRRRLERESLTVDDAERLLAGSVWTDDCPDWVDRLGEMLGYAESVTPSDDPTDRLDDVAFAEILAPFASFAAEQLSEESERVLTDDATRAATDWLVEELSLLASHTLFIEFRTFLRSTTDGEPPEPSPDETAYYEQFVTRTQGRLESLFREYPFLGRLVVVTVTDWVRMLDTLSERVLADADSLVDTFAVTTPTTVTAIDIRGDPLDDGSHVAHLTFGDGTSLAYKPRNATVGDWFGDTVGWLAEQSSLPDIRVPTVLCRDTYAWMEWIEPQDCSTAADVSAYFRRAGVLLFVFYATNVVDMHVENIIADGSHPVVIDMETTAHPTLVSGFHLADRSDDRETVRRTGAIPDHTEDGVEIACFGAGDVQFTANQHGFEAINTDAMSLVRDREVVADVDNLPTRDGQTASPSAHVEELVGGFEAAYEFALEHRDELLGVDGPAAQLRRRGGRVAVLFRNNRSYGAIRQQLTHQSTMKTGLRFGTAVESLAAPLLAREVDERTWDAFECERETLRRRNCPRFTAPVDDTTLYFGDEPLAVDALERTPARQIHRCFEELSRDDLDRQVEIIRSGFDS